MTPAMRAAATGEAVMSCDLGAGRLEVTVSDGDGPAAFAFGERANPRRAFLFVSRLLGRHIPVAPSAMRAAFTALADTVPGDLPGPVLMTGMAETAIGLGAGVHDAWLARTGRHDSLYLATTRTRMGSLAATFSEPHSHASGHLVHRPQHARDAATLAGARSLVMIDDEASSGTTFRNLAAGLAGAAPGIVRVHAAVLTDWSGAQDDLLPGVTTTRSALVRGRYVWHPRANAPTRTLADADVARQGVAPIRRDDDARLGRSIRSATVLPAGLEASLGSARRVLVLGTGEHVWEPFLIAEALERAGRDVRFGATTRSPILPGHAIRRGLTFRDHEGLGIANHLYNVDPAAWDRVVLCCDTSLDALDPGLPAALGADVVLGSTVHPAAGWRGFAPAEGFVAADMT
jgi:hypothetical protein